MAPNMAGAALADATLRVPAQRETISGATLWAAALALLAYAASILLFFRHSILSGFERGFGARGDSLIEISILEHWRAALFGVATWNQPLYFHPYADTLGYNDGYLLSGLIYSGWRFLFDPFIADTLTAFTFKTIGYFAALWLVRGVLRWSWGAAILIATLATISNNMYLQSGHAQIQTLALLPLLAGVAILAVRAEIAGEARARVFAALAAALLGLWLVSAFYFAWFTLYFSIVLVACWLWTTGNWRPAAFRALAEAHWRTLAAFAGTFVVAAVPFLFVYAPKMLETGGHGFLLSYTVQPTDLVNVGERNLLWGWIVQGLRMAVHAVSAPDGGLRRALLGAEHESGYPILLFALACAAGIGLVRRRGDNSFVRAFALAIVISWALTLRIWQVSPWILVHFLVPAASGMRVVLRYQLFLVLPVLLLVGTVYREQFGRLWQRKPLVAGGLVAVLLLEQVNFAEPLELNRSEQLAALGAVPAPPTGCKAFYVVTARVDEPVFISPRMHALYPHNVDAMFLAERWQLPTINGFSTFNPPDWNFAEPLAADYDARAMEYVKKHRLEGMCRLDMRAASPWTRV